jgi:dCTP deaminase
MMGVLADWQIEQRVALAGKSIDDLLYPPMQASHGIGIEPFAKECPKGVVSWGLSSYGYDVRVGYKFKVFTTVYCGIINPKNFDSRSFVDIDLTPSLYTHQYDGFRGGKKACTKCGATEEAMEKEWMSCRGHQPLDHVLIPPNSFALAETVETVTVPRDCVAILLDKSTYRRCGVIVSATVLEPEWTGKITIEISNTAPLPAMVFCNEGIAQILFLRCDDPESTGATCRTSYKDKKGRYQAQQGIVLPFVQ